MFIFPLFWKQLDYKSFGQWAVITGCTDGIGKGFAIEIAKLGMDVVLISRSKEKLESLAKELHEKYDVNTKIIVADFTNNDLIEPIIIKELDGMDIGLLINNVGTALKRLISFLDIKKEKVHDMVEVNLKSYLLMSSVVLKSMLTKNKGVIINVASLTAVFSTPGVSIYAATKAFVLKFSQDLAIEYKKRGIIVQCLLTGPVYTKLFAFHISKWITPTPELYARSALKRVGISTVNTGYPSHDILEIIFTTAGIADLFGKIVYILRKLKKNRKNANISQPTSTDIL